ncbi:hypothetical protein Tdes44962_MAKER02316 [Teratosphaeria destructans]|uniref:Erythromycin esterase n=1 Tax=Teratosphaeria destructans TaxID=418781 RepID=A0A9W7STZ2_9PEZI|nr:hypothetical protein Tdes44962_MAKER02316 [Teratosphaeria destructans]
MARRSSARLRSRNSTTPKRVSLSHELAAAPRTVPAKLALLQESDEMPGSFPQSPSGTPTRAAKRVNRGVEETPKATTPIEPSDEEMHPQAHHQTTHKPLEEARHLGFTNMAPHTAPPKQASRIATLQKTPTRSRDVIEDVKSPSFQFTFRREHSLELSPEAKRLMNEKREEAARIREQMVASGEGTNDGIEVTARKIATPKGKGSRFSDAHMAQFQKMDSIANHASAFRADPNRFKAAAAPPGTEAKSLKRSPSKAQLDERTQTLQRNPSKHALAGPTPGLTHAGVKADQQSSPSKRIRHTEADDVSATRPASSDSNQSPASTPQNASYPNLSHVTTPTQASLARAASVKPINNSKIPAPSLARSASKQNLTEARMPPSTPSLTRSPSKPSMHHAAEASRLLARSPTKAPLIPELRVQYDASEERGSPFLARSPLKASVPKKPENTESMKEPAVTQAPLLARSPLKGSLSKRPAESEEAKGTKAPEPPLLARSPFKMSIARNKDVGMAEAKEAPVHLLAKSPSKMALPSNKGQEKEAGLQTPGKSFGSNLVDRFNLLRASPVKSILRTPQRLYSDDPAKIAAGTHIATPPQQAGNKSAVKSGLPASASTRKHVDFTSSTKARYEASQSPTSSSRPSEEESSESASTTQSQEPSGPFGYPDLPSDARLASPSPQKRRTTVTPGDFTFRVGDQAIVFGQSPHANLNASKTKRPSIRQVSAESTLPPAEFYAPPTIQGSKKRKFEFENSRTAPPNDKENTPVLDDADDIDTHRPAKRAKTNPAEHEDVKKPSVRKPSGMRLPTLGVKPKGTKTAIGGGGGGAKDGKAKTAGARPSSAKPSTISQARLAALAQPKKRG